MQTPTGSVRVVVWISRYSAILPLSRHPNFWSRLSTACQLRGIGCLARGRLSSHIPRKLLSAPVSFPDRLSIAVFRDHGSCAKTIRFERELISSGERSVHSTWNDPKLKDFDPRQAQIYRIVAVFL